MRPPAVQSALQPQYRLALYKTWGRVGLSAIGPAGAVMTLILIGIGSGGCSMSRTDAAFARMRVHARDHNRRLSDVARKLIDGELDAAVLGKTAPGELLP